MKVEVGLYRRKDKSNLYAVEIDQLRIMHVKQDRVSNEWVMNKC